LGNLGLISEKGKKTQILSQGAKKRRWLGKLETCFKLKFFILAWVLARQLVP